MRLIDLSHKIEPDMPLFSEDIPKPVIKPWQSHENSAKTGHYLDTTCEITEIQFITSIGTYLDSPYHFHPKLPTIDELKLEQLIMPGILINCTNAQPNQPIEPDLSDYTELYGRAVLFHSGWSKYWGQPEYYQFPFMTEKTAKTLAENGARLVGVDWMVIDDIKNPRRPVHVTLLGNQIPIIENLTNLALLPQKDFLFHAVPVKVKGAAAFPVRAYAAVIE